MTDLNLVIKFKLAGDKNLHVEGASRIKIDGRGDLLLYDSTGEVTDRIATGALQSFSIHSISLLQSALAA